MVQQLVVVYNPPEKKKSEGTLCELGLKKKSHICLDKCVI